MAVLAFEQHLLFLAVADLVMMETNVKVSIMHVNVNIRDWSLIMSIDLGRATRWEIHGQKKHLQMFISQLLFD